MPRVLFSPPPSIFQTACAPVGLGSRSCGPASRARLGSEEGSGLQAALSGPGLGLTWRSGGRPLRSRGQDPRYGKWGQEGLGFIQGAACSRQPRCSCCFQMLQMKNISLKRCQMFSSQDKQSRTININ